MLKKIVLTGFAALLLATGSLVAGVGTNDAHAYSCSRCVENQ